VAAENRTLDEHIDALHRSLGVIQQAGRARRDAADALLAAADALASGDSTTDPHVAMEFAIALRQAISVVTSLAELAEGSRSGLETLRDDLQRLESQLRGLELGRAYEAEADTLRELAQRSLRDSDRLDALVQRLWPMEDRLKHMASDAERFSSHLSELERAISMVATCAERVRSTMAADRMAGELIREVLPREATHLATAVAANRDGGEALDAEVRSVSALLQGSVRLARLQFPPDRLATLRVGRDAIVVDVLRRYWTAWLGELGPYLLESAEAAQAAAGGEGGRNAPAFRESLRRLAADMMSAAALLVRAMGAQDDAGCVDPADQPASRSSSTSDIGETADGDTCAQ
jgi:hypothetical protein